MDECIRRGGWLIDMSGDGGDAVRLNSARGVIVGSTLHDALPGDVSNSCSRYSIVRGRPGQSVIAGAFETLDQRLAATGPASIGSYLLVTCPLAPGEAGAFLIGVDWEWIRTPLGMVFTEPLDVFTLPGGNASVSIAIPNSASLRGLPVVTQAVFLRPAFHLGNPSGVMIR
jgi:hypothetical protein